MRIIADENVAGDVVDALRREGHDVVWIRTEAPGSADFAILSRAQSERRVILTFDKDFGELAFHHRLPASSGIILFRISTPGSARAATIAVAALSSRTDWEGHLSVVESARIRMTRLPRIDPE